MLIIVALFVVINTAEPAYRHHARSLIDDNSVSIDCAGSNAESPECRSVSSQNNQTSSLLIEQSNEKEITEEEKSWNFADLFDDSTEGDEGM